MRLLSKTDREYLGAVVNAWWAVLVTVIMAGIAVLEKWFAIGIDVPRWALASLAFLALSFAQFEAFKKKAGEIEALKVTLEKKHSEDLENKDAVIRQKQEELSALKERISATPISFRVEADNSGMRKAIYVDVPVGGGIHRTLLETPSVSFAIWKKPSSADLEVSVTEYSLDTSQPSSHPPTFPARRLLRETESIEITERLVRFIGGDPFSLERLVRFSRDIRAVLAYEVLSVRGEVATNFRVNGNFSGGTLQLSIDHLPNPQRPTGGQ